jgi:hypothetical protein
MLLTGFCSSEFNVMNQDWIDSKSKKIYIDVTEEDKRKIIQHWQNMNFRPPIFEGGRIGVNVHGRLNLNSCLDKWMRYQCKIMNYKSAKSRGAKLVFKKCEDA